MSKPVLSAIESDVLRYLDRVGFASTACVQIAVRRNRYAVNDALNTLYKMRLIDRPKSGIAFSHKWLSKYAEERRQIELWLSHHFTL